MDVAGSMNIVFHADLSKLRRAPPERPVLGPAARLGRRRHRHGPGAHGAAVERVADRLGLRHQRAAARGRRRGRDHGSRTTSSATTRIAGRRSARRRCGRNNKMYADALSRGPRVLHGRRRPPAPAVQRAGLEHVDPGRLQPRLEAGAGAARARPAPALLDSYDAERAPVGQADRRPRANKSHRGVRPDLPGARPARHQRPGADAGQHAGAQAERHAGGRRAAARSSRDAIELKNYEFNAHGVEIEPALPLGARSWPTARPSPPSRATPSSTTTRRPGPARGCRTAGSASAGAKVSTLDLAGKGRFALLTGIGGEALGRGRGGRSPSAPASPIAAYVIGPGRESHDLYDDWARVREVRGGRLRARPPRRARRLARARARRRPRSRSSRRCCRPCSTAPRCWHDRAARIRLPARRRLGERAARRRGRRGRRRRRRAAACRPRSSRAGWATT